MQHHMHMGVTESEITTTVTYQEPIIKIHLEDQEGNPPKLVQTHEKYMHLIVVSEDLQEFYHVHPGQMDQHTYAVSLALKGEAYKVFVDINPNEKHYLIEPFTLEVNGMNQHLHKEMHSMVVDKEQTKEINGRKIELIHDPFKVGEEVSLRFDLKGKTPDPYLGALGHVVIIDEEVKQCIHVHPQSNHVTVFFCSL